MAATLNTIGVLGGMSWESTETYYRALNEGVKAELGGLHSAKILMHSFDFDDIEKLQMTGDWEKSATVLTDAALGLESAGADFIMIATNTMHLVADAVEGKLSVPLLHIADATALEVKRLGYRRVALLGTRFTMEEDFYKGRLSDKHGIEVMIPDANDRTVIHDVIYDELCQGKIQAASRDNYLRIINQLKAGGAEAIVLGCTEIGLLVGPADTDVPLLDTAKIHADAAVKMAVAR